MIARISPEEGELNSEHAVQITLGDIAKSDFACIVLSMLSFLNVFVCLSVTFVHCAQTAEDIDTISFPYDSSMSLPDRFNHSSR